MLKWISKELCLRFSIALCLRTVTGTPWLLPVRPVYIWVKDVSGDAFQLRAHEACGAAQALAGQRNLSRTGRAQAKDTKGQLCQLFHTFSANHPPTPSPYGRSARNCIAFWAFLLGFFLNTASSARNYRPSFRENKPKTLVVNDWIRSFFFGLVSRKRGSINSGADIKGIVK